MHYSLRLPGSFSGPRTTLVVSSSRAGWPGLLRHPSITAGRDHSGRERVGGRECDVDHHRMTVPALLRWEGRRKCSVVQEAR